MPGLRPDRAPIQLGIAIVTVSDTRDLAQDRSGDTLAERIAGAGHRLAGRCMVKDHREAIVDAVSTFVADPAVDVVLTTGGTGFTGRDVTPDAIEPLFTKRMDGFSTVFHQISYAKIGTSTIQSRGDRRADRHDVRVRAAGFAGGLPGRLGRDPGSPARLSLRTVQLRRDHAPPRRTSSARLAGRTGLISSTRARQSVAIFLTV